jgi:hypothetical protein
MLLHKSRIVYITIAILLFLTGFWICTYQRVENLNTDFSYYIGLAESILEKGDYTYNFSSHTLYPPGVPLIFALFGVVIPLNYDNLIRSMPILLFTSLLIFLRLRHLTSSEFTICGAILIFASSFQVFVRSTRTIGSEFPYMIFSFGSLLLIQNLDSNAKLIRSKAVLLCLLLSLCLLASVATRTIGIMLVGAAFAYAIGLFMRRKYLVATLVAISTIPSFLFQFI